MTNRYKLLKDLPDSKSGSIYGECDDSYYKNMNNVYAAAYPKQCIENNPDWFQEIKEPERIEVSVDEDIYSSRHYHSDDKGQFYPYRLKIYTTENPSPLGKIPAIKQAIENVLNGYKEYPEGYWVHKQMINKMSEIYGLKYTQEQMDEAIKDAFYAGRTLTTGKMTGYLGTDLKYSTFQDYLSSLKK